MINEEIWHYIFFNVKNENSKWDTINVSPKPFQNDVIGVSNITLRKWYNWTKWTRWDWFDPSGLQFTNWTKVSWSGSNGPTWTKMDQSGLKQTKWDWLDWYGLNRLKWVEVDQYEPTIIFTMKHFPTCLFATTNSQHAAQRK